MDIHLIRASSEYRKLGSFIEKTIYLLDNLCVGVTKASEILESSRGKVKRKYINHVRGFKNAECINNRYLNEDEKVLLVDTIRVLFGKNKCPTIARVQHLVRNNSI